MKIIKWKFGGVAPKIDKNISIAIGNFDGIHQGHVKLLETAKLNALENNLAFGVVTFDPHPRDFFSSGNSSFKLLDALEKENLLREIGVNYLIIIEFNEELKNCSANDFLSKILNETFKVTKMFAGSNFRFGKNREGTIEGNRNFASKLGLEIIAVDLKQTHSIKGKELEIISSQTIRKLIQDGQLNIANSLLGRNWCITGVVEQGKQQGREIGFPTANLDIKKFLKPPLGVYVTRLKITDQKELETSNDWLPSISNIGTRPTVSGDSINLETHVIDLNNENLDINLYGKRIKVELLEFLRSETKFNSLSELKKQIELDTKMAYDFHKLKSL
jgi:riboflavin kinase/FMN adenylyltransferase|tara:strand:- start:2033 stop:3028 length:996 start_codon:yes stop_codon:yes gene_type:complete